MNGANSSAIRISLCLSDNVLDINLIQNTFILINKVYIELHSYFKNAVNSLEDYSMFLAASHAM